MNPVKIAIIGTHGIGKTALIQRIKEKVGPELLTPPELARDILEALKMDWREAEWDRLRDFQLTLLSYTMLVSQMPGPLLADRCPLDVLAYMTYQNPANNIVTNIFSLAEQAALRYNHIYFYRAYSTSLSDEQQAIQSLLKKICKILSIATIDFTRADADQIVNSIVKRYTLTA